MATPNKTKRLDRIETQLMPKEWVIRLADDIRKYPSQQQWHEAAAAGNKMDELTARPYEALNALVIERYPATKTQEDIRIRNHFRRTLFTEFRTLYLLIMRTNANIDHEATILGLEAGLKLAQLQTLILQDAFSRTAEAASDWLEDFKAADKEEEKNLKIMIAELGAYTSVSFAERFGDSLPLGPNVRIRFPSPIEEWVKSTRTMIAQVFAYEAAVKAIQTQFFDGHSILFRDTEAKLENAVTTVQNGAATFNDYLKVRSNLFKAIWDEEEQEESGIASAIPGEREGKLAINLDAIKSEAGRQQSAALVSQWHKAVKSEAVIENSEGNAEHRRLTLQYFKDVGGIKS